MLPNTVTVRSLWLQREPGTGYTGRIFSEQLSRRRPPGRDYDQWGPGTRAFSLKELGWSLNKQPYIQPSPPGPSDTPEALTKHLRDHNEELLSHGDAWRTAYSAQLPYRLAIAALLGEAAPMQEGWFATGGLQGDAICNIQQLGRKLLLVADHAAEHGRAESTLLAPAEDVEALRDGGLDTLDELMRQGNALSRGLRHKDARLDWGGVDWTEPQPGEPPTLHTRFTRPSPAASPAQVRVIGLESVSTALELLGVPKNRLTAEQLVFQLRHRLLAAPERRSASLALAVADEIGLPSISSLRGYPSAWGTWTALFVRLREENDAALHLRLEDTIQRRWPDLL